MPRNPFHDELLKIMLADAREIEDAMSQTELDAAQARLDVNECHPFAVGAYWGEMPPLTRLKEAGEHVRLRRLAAELRKNPPE